MMRCAAIWIGCFALWAYAGAAAAGKAVTVMTDLGTTLDAYEAGPADAGKGIILFHDRWGLDALMLERADRLAAKGYRVLAVDLFDGRRASPGDDQSGRQIMQQVDPVWAEANVKAAILHMINTTPKVAVVGWGYGGGNALRAAMWMPDAVAAAVDFYGPVETNTAQLRRMVSPVLGIFAERDPWVTPAEVDHFVQSMRQARVPLALVRVDADHGFADPRTDAYDDAAASQAWQRMESFLAEVM